LAAASIKAIDIIEEENTLREKLDDNSKYLRAQIKLMGFDIMNSRTPIIPILIKDTEQTLKFSKKLLDKGIYVSAIRPPTVPVNTSRLRLTTMATHTKDQLDFALNQIQNIGRELRLI